MRCGVVLFCRSVEYIIIGVKKNTIASKLAGSKRTCVHRCEQSSRTVISARACREENALYSTNAEISGMRLKRMHDSGHRYDTH